ncbi:Nucleolar MIF4G domain-containing protein 1 [Dichanthelium oligosanthes]|uniref:Nucleolar MIF4G domain-containing protein 1 n=1 Tax=Dichanthelium oligosanthes TaxID=888268 RepID=A0A1E5WGY5_9POAL|nr:Nucleolar MIF4G domain-containing protein 1 [Dichanthelium oligosanthes]
MAIVGSSLLSHHASLVSLHRKSEQKSRKERRKEARSEKQKLRFLSWVQHQGGKNKKLAMPAVEPSPTKENKPKKEPAAVKKKRKREAEGKHKPKSNFQEYLEMEMGGAVSMEEDLEMERRLAKKLKVKKGKLGGPDDGMDELFADLGFGGDFGSDDETKANDWNVEDDTKLDRTNGKKKKKKVKKDDMETEELDVGDEENDWKMKKKKKKKKVKKDDMEMEEPDNGGEENTGKNKKKTKKVKKDDTEVEEPDDEDIDMDEENDGAALEFEDGEAHLIRRRVRAFVAGMACLVGIDFSAKILASIAKSFEDEYSKDDNISLRNLTLLFCYLCIFGVISSDLVYDLLSILSKRLTELDVSTVLTILQCCGMKLRGDDPGAMKDFVLSIQNSVNQLKLHSGVREDGKTETLSRRLKAEDFLLRGLTWSRLLDPDKKGQWWLSGDVPSTADAFEKLLRLGLSGKQACIHDREIIRVIVDCCLQEKMFNKYYTVLASKLCSHEKNHKFSLQYCIWDHFKELDNMEPNRSMNLAKLVAEMLSNFTLSLATLKIVNLANPVEMTAERIAHFRMLFETLLQKDDTLVWNVFTRVAGLPELEILRDGIVVFIKQHVIAEGARKDLSNKFKIAKKALDNTAGVLICVPRIRIHLGMKFFGMEGLNLVGKEKISRKYNVDAGLIVVEVSGGSNVEKLGVRMGDIVQAVNGKCIATTIELENMFLDICKDHLEKGIGCDSDVDVMVVYCIRDHCKELDNM